jgi:hypothetical protein
MVVNDIQMDSWPAIAICCLDNRIDSFIGILNLLSCVSVWGAQLKSIV